MIVGITGGIGSGKTTLCNRLRKDGYLVFDADVVARNIQNNDSSIRKQLIDLFGPESYTQDGLNRPFVASVVFNDTAMLEKLNAIVHPAVLVEFEKWIAENSARSILFVESAILLKGKLRPLIDKIVIVIASEETRIKRVCERDGVNEDQVRNRISKQVTNTELLKQADFVIDTDIKQIHELSIPVFIDYIKHLRK